MGGGQDVRNPVSNCASGGVQHEDNYYSLSAVSVVKKLSHLRTQRYAPVLHKSGVVSD